MSAVRGLRCSVTRVSSGLSEPGESGSRVFFWVSGRDPVEETPGAQAGSIRRPSPGLAG